MAFNLPGILGRNSRARQAMVEDAVYDAGKAAEVHSNKMYGESYKRATKAGANNEEAAKTAQGPADSSYQNKKQQTIDKVSNAAADKSRKLEEQRKTQTGDNRPKRSEVRSANKDFKALDKAAERVAREEWEGK
jgi:hypothetical protein